MPTQLNLSTGVDKRYSIGGATKVMTKASASAEEVQQALAAEDDAAE